MLWACGNYYNSNRLYNTIYYRTNFLLFKQPASYAKQFGGKVMNDDDDIISILKA